MFAALSVEELRQSWQGRLLTQTGGQVAAVVLSMIAHSWPDDFEWLLRACFPGYRALARPMYVSCGKIAPSGRIVADLLPKEGPKLWKTHVFASEAEMQGCFRQLADILKLNDKDRIEMFKMVKRWLVADWRVMPDGSKIVDGKRVA